MPLLLHITCRHLAHTHSATQSLHNLRVKAIEQWQTCHGDKALPRGSCCCALEQGADPAPLQPRGDLHASYSGKLHRQSNQTSEAPNPQNNLVGREGADGKYQPAVRRGCPLALTLRGKACSKAKLTCNLASTLLLCRNICHGWGVRGWDDPDALWEKVTGPQEQSRWSRPRMSRLDLLPVP